MFKELLSPLTPPIYLVHPPPGSLGSFMQLVSNEISAAVGLGQCAFWWKGECTFIYIWWAGVLSDYAKHAFGEVWMTWQEVGGKEMGWVWSWRWERGDSVFKKECQMSSVFSSKYMFVLLDLKTIWEVFLVAGQGGECWVIRWTEFCEGTCLIPAAKSHTIAFLFKQSHCF